MAITIQLRNDTTANWNASNPILAQAEIGVDTDTNQFKIGDGATHWADLPNGGLVGPTGPSGVLPEVIDNTNTTAYTVDSNKLTTIPASDPNVTVTLGNLDAGVMNTYTVSFTQGNLTSITIDPGSTGLTIQYADNNLPTPASGSTYILSVMVTGDKAIASAILAS